MYGNCSICVSNLIQSEANICATTCGHVFHFHCLQQWRQISNKCPMCRFESIGEVKLLYFSVSLNESIDVSHEPTISEMLARKEQEIEKKNLSDKCFELERKLEAKRDQIHALNKSIKIYHQESKKLKESNRKLNEKNRKLENKLKLHVSEASKDIDLKKDASSSTKLFTTKSSIGALKIEKKLSRNSSFKRPVAKAISLLRADSDGALDEIYNQGVQKRWRVVNGERRPLRDVKYINYYHT